ncbi:Uncharacterised protein [Mycobacterium tuberculosis]|nr:Uncharacterised protein [Mycobacterium tuberculosis]
MDSGAGAQPESIETPIVSTARRRRMEGEITGPP